ncbi:uncharacterized protein LOC121522967 [Cheilinus undulatus]|uniref:uncharacterized protein LOC121522967 n=1 Tax=Cheilinus undulatus TaxID=241271 RepID=UPI001BD66DA8|nr:uncharacterized protein LOC121522967 [Cheilinus undulatus]
MDQTPKLQAHVSIQERFSHPPLKKCENCCIPSRYHCPFCIPEFFKPSKLYMIREHMESHFKRAVFAGKYTFHKCALGCRDTPHYHCLFCQRTLIRKIDFKRHVVSCNRTYKQIVEKLGQKTQAEGLQATLNAEESASPSLDVEKDDDFIDVNMISDPEDQTSQEEGRSDTLTIHDFGYKAEKPVSSTCHQTVQTNFDQPQDCDEFYFMNLVKLFKKLSNAKKADVRMKIERILLEAGFE